MPIYSSGPSWEGDCVKLVVANTSYVTAEDMTWISHDCGDLNDVKPICEYPSPLIDYNGISNEQRKEQK